MKKLNLLIILVFISFSYIACEKEDPIKENFESRDIKEKSIQISNSKFLVANRNIGTLSLFNANNAKKIRNINIPGNAQPTYIATNQTNEIYVADFERGLVWVYRKDNLELTGRIKVEKGSFHMWFNKNRNQLWVNNIISKTTSVIDLTLYKVIKNLKLPTNISRDAEQHDVVISEDGRRAYVTVLIGDQKSLIFMYDTDNLKLLRKVTVGGDAHLFTIKNRVYVPVQNANRLVVFDLNLDRKCTIPLSSAHGITGNDQYLFVTSIKDKKVTILDRKTLKRSDVLNTQFETPHNLAITDSGKRLIISFSGANSRKATIWKIENGKFKQSFVTNSGLNPFGVVSLQN
ncbi:YncE family protein [Aquimarina celericrescens]|uniref:YncE family protein n=1 Tax=Aquimarina celericrescens TaxID=1964542 RepID=A0ABW5B2H9_9FLAO|nr:hypothetical protein [Aquimarina celericrescens]